MVNWFMVCWIVKRLRKMIWMRGGEFHAFERICGDCRHVGVVQIPGDRRRGNDGQRFLSRLLQDKFGLSEAICRRSVFVGLDDLVGHDQWPRGSGKNGLVIGKGVGDVVFKVIIMELLMYVGLMIEWFVIEWLMFQGLMGIRNMVKRYVVIIIINLSMHRPVLFHYLLDWHIGGSWLKVDRFRFNRLMFMWLMAMRFMVMRLMVVRFMVMRFMVNRVMVWKYIDRFESVLVGRTWDHVTRRMRRDGRQRDVVVVFGVGLVVDDGVVVGMCQ